MRLVVPEADDLARQAADLVAAAARAAIAARGGANLAFSGGRTPGAMFRALAAVALPWPQIHIFQTDERVVPADDPARNWTLLTDALLAQVPLPPQNRHAMPVERSDLAQAAQVYAADIRAMGGVFDLVHLGLGDDGHTASLVPGDPTLAILDSDVAVSLPYQGHRRMTLTYPALDRARAVLWLVTGAGKAEMLQRLWKRDPSIPAGRVTAANATIIADPAAARLIPGSRSQ